MGKGEKSASREKAKGRRSLVRGGWRDMVKPSRIAGGCTHGTWPCQCRERLMPKNVTVGRKPLAAENMFRDWMGASAFSCGWFLSFPLFVLLRLC